MGGAGIAIKILNNIGGVPSNVLTKAESTCHHFIELLRGVCDKNLEDLSEMLELLPQSVRRIVEVAAKGVSSQGSQFQQISATSFMQIGSATVPVVIRPGHFSSVTEECSAAVSNIVGMMKGLLTTQRQLYKNATEMTNLILTESLRNSLG